MTEPHPVAAPSARVESEAHAVERLLAAFWRRYHANPDVPRKLAGKNRVILLDVTDGDGHTFHVVDGKIARVDSHRHSKPDVVVSLNRHDLFALFNGELKPFHAFTTRRVKVKASFIDLLFAKSLLGW